MKAKIIFQVLLFILFCHNCFGQHYGNVNLEPESKLKVKYWTLNKSANPGTLCLYVDINNGYLNTLSWTVKARATQSSNEFVNFTRTLKVPGGQRRKFELAIPVGLAEKIRRYTNFRLVLQGPDIKSSSLNVQTNNRIPHSLISSKLYQELQNDIDDYNKSHSSKQKNFLKFRPEDIPTQWSSLTGYTDIIMLRSELNSLPKEKIRTLYSWISTGGTLQILYNSFEESDKTSERISDLASPGIIGLGRVTTADLANLSIETLRNDSSPTPLIEKISGADYTSEFPNQLLKAPAQFLLLCYFLAVVIISIGKSLEGPQRLAYLGLNSLLFVAVIFISIVIIGGMGNMASRSTLIFATNGYATSIQNHRLRSGLLMNRNIQAPAKGVLLPVDLRNIKETSIFDLNFYSSENTLTGDWLRSGQISHHALLNSFPFSRAIEIEPTNGQVSVYNRLNTTVIALFVSREPSCYFAENIGPGERSTLQELECGIHPQMKKAFEKLIDDPFVAQSLETLTYHQHGYVAFTGRLKQLETINYPGIAWRDRGTIIFGISGLEK